MLWAKKQLDVEEQKIVSQIFGVLDAKKKGKVAIEEVQNYSWDFLFELEQLDNDSKGEFCKADLILTVARVAELLEMAKGAREELKPMLQLMLRQVRGELSQAQLQARLDELDPSSSDNEDEQRPSTTRPRTLKENSISRIPSLEVDLLRAMSASMRKYKTLHGDDGFKSRYEVPQASKEEGETASQNLKIAKALTHKLRSASSMPELDEAWSNDEQETQPMKASFEIQGSDLKEEEPASQGSSVCVEQNHYTNCAPSPDRPKKLHTDLEISPPVSRKGSVFSTPKSPPGPKTTPVSVVGLGTLDSVRDSMDDETRRMLHFRFSVDSSFQPNEILSMSRRSIQQISAYDSKTELVKLDPSTPIHEDITPSKSLSQAHRNPRSSGIPSPRKWTGDTHARTPKHFSMSILERRRGYRTPTRPIAKLQHALDHHRSQRGAKLKVALIGDHSANKEKLMDLLINRESLPIQPKQCSSSRKLPNSVVCKDGIVSKQDRRRKPSEEKKETSNSSPKNTSRNPKTHRRNISVGTILGMRMAQKDINLHGREVDLNLFSLTGDNNYRHSMHVVITDAVAIGLVFSCIDEASLNNIKEWYKRILPHRSHNSSIILIGNHSSAARRKLSEEGWGKIRNKARKYAKKAKAKALVFCDSETQVNVAALLPVLVRHPLKLPKAFCEQQQELLPHSMSSSLSPAPKIEWAAN